MLTRITAALLDNVLPNDMLDKLDKDQRFTIEMSLVKHLLKLTSYKEYVTSLKPMMKVCYIRILRKEMLANFEYAIRLKYSMLTILREKNPSPAEIREIFARFNLKDHSRLLRGLQEDSMWNAGKKKAKQAFITETNENQVIANCNRVMKNIEEYLIKFTKRKLRFIITSNNFDVMDIVSELREKAVRAFYELTPFLSPEHIINAVKRAAHNFGINRIKHYTAGKRSRLNTDGAGGFQITEVSYHTVSDSDGESVDSENFRVMGKMVEYDDRIPMHETRIAYQSLMRTHGQHPRKRKVLELIGMMPDQQFADKTASMFPGIVRPTYTTEEIFDKLGRDKFLTAVQKYVNVNPLHFHGFLTVLQKTV